MPDEQGELAQRAAILDRLKDLFYQQIEQFHKLLTVLENQQTAIESGSGESVLAYIEIEESIVAGIVSTQKVIDPLETMYIPAEPANEQAKVDISTQKSTLEYLKNRAIVQSEHNKSLISGRMANIGTEIKTLKNDPWAIAARRSIYNNTSIASLIDIEG